MTWLAALIVANVAYVGWGWTSGESESPVARPQRSSIGPSLRLLTELPPGAVETVAGERTTIAPRPRPVTTPERQPPPMICRSWGPFRDRHELEAVQREIDEAGGDTRVTETSVAGRSDYLVYIGTPGKADNARRVLEELKSQSIDSALITRGRFNNTLSVGVFSRADRAERQLQRVAKLGYDAGIHEIARSYSVFRLEAHVQPDFEPAVPPSGPCSEIAQAH